MADGTNTGVIFRDGLSQKARALPALDPDYFSVEEHTQEDLIRFAQEFSNELKFYNLDGTASGSWSEFLTPPTGLAITITDMLDFYKNPTLFDHLPEKKAWLTRPHFTLFMAFLDMLKEPKAQLDDLTRRHLDFYFRQVLRFQPQPAEPDKVHVVFEPARNIDKHLLAQNTTLLHAGKDSTGKPLHYALVDNLIVTQAKVVDIRRVFQKDGKVYSNVSWYEGMKEKENFKYQALGVDLSQQENAPLAEIGFAFTSQLLMLSSGKRTITLNLELNAEGVDMSSLPNVQQPFIIKISTQDGWLDLENAGNNNSNSADFKFKIEANQPAITPISEGLYSKFSYPVITFILRQELFTSEHLKIIKKIKITKATLKVDVEVLEGLKIRNDDAILSPKSSFQLFGAYPVAGSSFNFAHSELLTKPINSFSFSFNWKNTPANFTQHYLGYWASKVTNQVLNNNSFKVTLNDSQGKELGVRQLFQSDTTTNSKLEFKDFLTNNIQNEKKLLNLENPDDFPYYYSLRLLHPDLQHKNYPLAMISMAANSGKLPTIGLCKTECNGKKGKLLVLYSGAEKTGLSFHTRVQQNDNHEIEFYYENNELHLKLPTDRAYLIQEVLETWERFQDKKQYTLVKDDEGEDCINYSQDFKFEFEAPLLNPPYTPEVQSFLIGYSAESELNINSGDFLQILPFGYKSYSKNDTISPIPIIAEEGNLFIGLTNTEDTEELNLLLQLLPGVSDTDKPVIKWHYLDNDCWIPLEDKRILIDRTNQLLNAGLVRLTLPQVASLEHHAMPTGLYWLKASAETNAIAAGDLIAIHAQAAEALWQDNGNAAGHLAQPLPANSIKELVKRDSNIRSVVQPYTSYGGRMPEPDKHLYTRASERLRHKQRALTLWDYERLVLDRFPDIYKVKCLQAWEKTRLQESKYQDPSVGKVVLVVIPSLANKAPFFPQKPRISNALREEIKAYLKEITSPFADIEVRNPRYEIIRYRMDIRFHKEYQDKEYYVREVNRALQRFLSPWAYDGSADISFGSRIYHASVIYFLENLPYVDYVVNFKLVRQYFEGEAEYGCIEDLGFATARCPDSIMVSHLDHFIERVKIDNYQPEQFKGVGYDRIRVDLHVYKTG